MKRLLLVFGLLFLTGCDYESYPTYVHRNSNEFIARSQQLDNRLMEIKSRTQVVSERQIAFMKTLNDQQLAVYELATQAYKSDEPATQEVAKRNLHQVLDANDYATAIEILNDKKKLRHDNDDLGVDWNVLREEWAAFKRQIGNQ